MHKATTLHPPVHMRDPEPPLRERLVGPLWLPGQLRTAWLLRRPQDLHRRERAGQAAQSLPPPTAGRERVGGGLRDAQIIGPAAVGVAQKEAAEQGMAEQAILDDVVLVRATLTRGLVRRVLGAEDAPCGPVMGTRGEGGQWLVWRPPPAA